MKYITTGLIIPIIFSLNIAWAGEYGFKDVPFGTDFQVVWEKYGKDDILGRDFYYKRKYIQTQLLLGERKFKVQFLFDYDYRFYMVEIFHFPGLNASFLETDIKKKVDFINEMFKAKFGEPKFRRE